MQLGKTDSLAPGFVLDQRCNANFASSRLPFIDRDEFGIPLIIAGVKLTDIASETRANFVRSGRRTCSVADVCCLSFSYVRFVPINIAGKDHLPGNVLFHFTAA